MTRFRHRVFTGGHLERLEQIMRDVCADFETDLAEFNGESDHVHLLVDLPPKVAPSNQERPVPRRRSTELVITTQNRT